MARAGDTPVQGFPRVEPDEDDNDPERRAWAEGHFDKFAAVLGGLATAYFLVRVVLLDWILNVV